MLILDRNLLCTISLADSLLYIESANFFIREYDVPYHVRAAIDLKIFVVSEKIMDKFKLNLMFEFC